MIISKFMFWKNQLEFLAESNFAVWQRGEQKRKMLTMEKKNRRNRWCTGSKAPCAYPFALFFDLAGDSFSSLFIVASISSSHFPSRSFTLTAIICLNSRTNCSTANNLFKGVFCVMYTIWNMVDRLFWVFKLKLSTQKKSNIISLSQYDSQWTHRYGFFIEQTIK